MIGELTIDNVRLTMDIGMMVSGQVVAMSLSRYVAPSLCCSIALMPKHLGRSSEGKPARL